MYIPTYEDMLAAHERIRPYIRLTPVRSSDFLNDLTGAELFFKCENFQEPGAFKVRGATNAVFGLDDAQAAVPRSESASGSVRAISAPRVRLANRRGRKLDMDDLL